MYFGIFQGPSGTLYLVECEMKRFAQRHRAPSEDLKEGTLGHTMSRIPDFAKIDFAPSASAATGGGEPWLTPEGIPVKPAYGPDDLAGIDFLDTYPGIAPYLRGPYPTMYVDAAVDHPAVRRLLHRGGLQRVLPAQSGRRAEGPLGRVRSRHPSRLRQRPSARRRATSAWRASRSTRSTTCGRCSPASRSTR